MSPSWGMWVISISLHIPWKRSEKKKKATEELLERLQKLGGYVSAEKAWVCSNKVTYLRTHWGLLQEDSVLKPDTLFWISLSHGLKGRWENSWVQLNTADCGCPTLWKWQNHYTRVWEEMGPPSEEGKEKEAFQKIKETLMWAPVLRLPDIDKPFHCSWMNYMEWSGRRPMCPIHLNV